MEESGGPFSLCGETIEGRRMESAVSGEGDYIELTGQLVFFLVGKENNHQNTQKIGWGIFPFDGWLKEWTAGWQQRPMFPSLK
jgi:hypothetical protein